MRRSFAALCYFHDLPTSRPERETWGTHFLTYSPIRKSQIVDGCDLVVHRFGIMPGQILAEFFWDDGGFVIRAGDRANDINGLPEHDGDELDFLPCIPPQQVAALVSFSFADARQQFRF